MVGINLPTLNFFDVLAFEVEHRDWDFQNNIKNAKSGEPVWGNANQAPGTGYDPNHPGKLDTSDAVKAQGDKWSFYAKKQLIHGVSLYVQVASDYLRGIDPQIFLLSDEVITSRPSQWYYLFRLEFGI